VTLVPTSLDEIDFWDLDMFVEGEPHRAWSLLREQAPVWYHDRPGGEPFWCLTRYDDARSVLGQATLFSSEEDGIALRDAVLLANPQPVVAKPMIHTDPPRHTPLRRVILPRFLPGAIARLEEQVRSYARSCLAEAADKRDVDFVTDIAHRIPAAIALSLLGVPEARWDRLAELEHVMLNGADPEYSGGQEYHAAAQEAGLEVQMYFADLIRQRMQEPGDDLLSVFLLSELDGRRLPFEQVVAEAGLLLAGGLDTTRAAASAGAMLPFMAHPEQLSALRDDPSLMTTAVEEFLRWGSPIVHEARTATADVDFQGYHFRKGDRVSVWSPSANRDESQFPDPFRFDIRRSPNRHLSFAYGEHFCLGAHLARLTLRVEFEELLARFRDFEQTGPEIRVRSNFVGGLKRLPMHLTPS
jgi:cytochrome P450